MKMPSYIFVKHMLWKGVVAFYDGTDKEAYPYEQTARECHVPDYVR